MPLISGSRFRWLAAGLLLVTCATLMLEIIDSRLLSVLTWYHLAFLAVSLAMLGMAAGAVLVFVGGERFTGDRGLHGMSRLAHWFAFAIPLSHVINLVLPIPVLESLNLMEVIGVALATVVLATPFFLSGMVVTIALTRTGGPIGRLYAADLIGAALGCLLVIPLLGRTNISSAALIAGALAAASAYCFSRVAGAIRPSSLLLCVILIAAAGANVATDRGLAVVYAKDRKLTPGDVVQWSAWNTHSHVAIFPPSPGPAFYWGRGRVQQEYQATLAWIVIDGAAGTPITQWNGDVSDLQWVSYDVTTLPYHLRRGDAAIIGVGGGRDILSALWGGNRSIIGIEINDNLVRALQGPYRDFANITTRPEVTIVRDEARSYLTRTDKQFDVLQMSLIDTWAATGAGAFTLTENGLYTVDAWRVFLDRLAPGGVFSISRWFSPSATSETSRLLALGVAALLDRGVANPIDHMIALARGNVATLVLSNQPFTEADRLVVGRLVGDLGFSLLTTPWTPPIDDWIGGIVRSRSRSELDAAIEHEMFDFSPPTDARPFFFNTLKPSSFHRAYDLRREGIIWGNLRATWTLVLLFIVATTLVVALIAWPLFRSGLPTMSSGSFAASVAYFALIGMGYMLIQIPFMQRFSVYLGHPTYTLAIILFSMILFTGVGSFLSDSFPIDRRGWLIALPVTIAVVTIAIAMAMQPLVDSTIDRGLLIRSAIVVLVSAPLSMLLGFCFPIGIKLVNRLSPDATAWMWGVNGAASVMASIIAVAISMWMGIHVNLFAAAMMYTLLAVPASVLQGRPSAG